MAVLSPLAATDAPTDGPAAPDGGDVMVLIEGADLGCGELLLLVHKRVRELPGGTLVAIATTDPAAPIDIPAWCHLTGHRYIGPSTAVTGSPFVVELAQRAAPTDPDRPWHRQSLTETT